MADTRGAQRGGAGLGAVPAGEFSRGGSHFVGSGRAANGDTLSAAQPGGLRLVLERSRLRYTLYYPQPPAPSGTFRRIRVELAPAVRLAHPGARVRARTGYYSRGAK
ncbi:hypothetical protein [uncultured Paludibaculum sp.]|uniref:hypothetical protein n=1 Tax=uncultured Paludibaculum sp. TaxID=1765020 RepID=UPI002AAA7B4E|nr:hypothetical protein [uncultured Paludibaculum sp.]